MARTRHKPEEIVAKLRQVEGARPRSAANASRARRRSDRMRPVYAACRVGSVIELWRDTRAGASSGK
jgi:hypothetical protein